MPRNPMRDCITTMGSPDCEVRVARVPLVSPYAFQWIPVNDPSIPESGSLERATQIANQPRICNTSEIHEGDVGFAQNVPMGKWHHISIEVDGELAFPADDLAPIDACNVPVFGMRSSMLKARVKLRMAAGCTRFFDFDIDAGVEFDVAAYSVDGITLLIPDPRVEIPNELPPVGVDPGPLQLVSKFTSTVYFTPKDPQGYAEPLTYTVPFVLGVGQEMFVPRTADAQFVRAVVDGSFGGLGSIAVDFIHVPGELQQATYVAPPTFFPGLGTLTIGPAETVSEQPQIPGMVNAFRIRRTDEAPLIAGSLIQILNV